MLWREPGWSESSDALGARYHGYHLTALVAVAILALFAATAQAATITVNSLADPGAPGICALRDAITAANTEAAVNGCVAGTGDDTIVFSLTGTITLSDGTLPANVNILTIQGPTANPPAIAVNAAEVSSVMAVNPGTTLKLAYLTIDNGSAEVGAGIYNGGTLTVINSTFDGNSVSGEGGGGIFSFGTLTVTNSTFDGNDAGGLGGGLGGGILNFGTLTVANSTFDGNSADDFGGGIFNYDKLSVTNSTFDGNSAAFDGGGIASEGPLTVTNSTFDANSASNAGGGIVILGGGTADIKGTILAASTNGNCFGSIITDEGFNLDDDGTCDFASGTTPDTDIALDPAGLQNNGGPTQTVALESNSVAINQIPVPDCTDQSSPPVRLLTDQRGVIRPQFTACDIGAYEYDTARSLKTNVRNAIDGITGVSRKNQQTLKLASGSLYQALLLLSGDDGNSVSPALGGLEFQTEQTAVQLLAGLAPSSALSSTTLDTWLLNITIADRTLAVVAISNVGGDAEASQLVADGDNAVAAGYYLTAIKDYAQAWSLVQG